MSNAPDYDVNLNRWSSYHSGSDAYWDPEDKFSKIGHIIKSTIVYRDREYCDMTKEELVVEMKKIRIQLGLRQQEEKQSKELDEINDLVL